MAHAISLVVLLLSVLPLAFSAENVTTIGKPISIPASQYWDGDDGPWSSFRIQVGTPAQQIRVLPALDQSSTLVVLPEACSTTDGSNCDSDRGFLYERNASSTWSQTGFYNLSLFLESRLGYSGAALYGNDTLQLGWEGDGLPSVTNQVIGGIVTKDFYIGMLALDPRPMNFSNFNDPQPSLMQSLRSMGTPIPTTSWSYTAGAYNLAPKIFGSLTLGGYDSTRFEPNNVTFPFGADISLDFQVAIQSITTNITDKPLLNAGIISYIDTMIPHIWLPLDSCQLFEEAFGLVWDNTTELYLMNNSLHNSLLAKNPEVVFNVGPQLSGPSVAIKMPYWNFYQTATSAYIGNSSSLYFPLKRATSDLQYVLGRAFMQSAYLSANYDRSYFNLSQALYPPSSVSQNIVPILPELVETNSTTPASASTNSSFSAGAIAGIAVGAAALIIIGVVCFLVYRRNKKRRSDPTYKKAELEGQDTQVLGGNAGPKTELDGDNTRHEIGGDSHGKTELHTGDEHVKIAEMEGQATPIFEMPAGDVQLPELESPDQIQKAELEGSTPDQKDQQPSFDTVVATPNSEPEVRRIWRLSRKAK
ncbi:acid protease [Glonium stellatum]|uniref:Acid protease n=1 Tax=Glonium stellatum TaxID=574774 RepID=A0A8E2JVD0_9PEZI|nr:acid protease [Glonium stellatum]